MLSAWVGVEKDQGWAVPPHGPRRPSSSNSIVFWFGDLNFRIESYDLHFVKFAIDNDKLHQLWEKDQVQNPSLHPPNPQAHKACLRISVP